MAAETNTEVSLQVAQCLELVFQLPETDRLLVAETILGEVADFADDEIRQSWVEESVRRLAAYHAGELKTRPAEEVLKVC